MDVYLNSFTPLCTTKKGRESSTLYKLPPFVDGSCRREPDFEKEKPPITGLCRPGKLIPRLKPKDLIIYITNKRRYYNNYGERLFVGILEVEKILPSHEAAMEWYYKNGFELSQNIMCRDTLPLNLNYTHTDTNGKIGDKKEFIANWDAQYKYRSLNYPEVVQNKVWNNHMHLSNPRKLKDDEMIAIFNRIPGTQNPPKLRDGEWNRFQEIILTEGLWKIK